MFPNVKKKKKKKKKNRCISCDDGFTERVGRLSESFSRTFRFLPKMNWKGEKQATFCRLFFVFIAQLKTISRKS